MPEKLATRAGDSMVRDYVHAVLRLADEYDAARRAEITRLEAEGYRIVGGGQVDDDSWEITDMRTREVLARGDTGMDGFEAAWDALSATEPLFHADAILEGAEAERVWLDGPELPPGMPESLAGALAEWAEDHPEEALAWVR